MAQGNQNNQDKKPGGKNLFRKLRKQVKSLEAYSSGGSGAPQYTFDPALEYQRGTQARGLLDQGDDALIAARQLRRDSRTQLKDIRYAARTGRQDIARNLERGLEGVGFKKEDVRTKRARGREDFGRQLDLLTRKYQQLAGVQRQQGNAYGTLGGGTSEASAVARARNEQIAADTINTNLARLEEDSTLNLGRLSGQAEDYREDALRAQQRLRRDRRHDVRLTKRGQKGELRRLRRELNRAVREQRFGDIALRQQQIYQKKQNRPGGE